MHAMYVCRHVCMSVCMYVCMYVCVYVCTSKVRADSLELNSMLLTRVRASQSRLRLVLISTAHQGFGCEVNLQLQAQNNTINNRQQTAQHSNSRYNPVNSRPVPLLSSDII